MANAKYDSKKQFKFQIYEYGIILKYCVLLLLKLILLV
jgi:hypothetical protein